MCMVVRLILNALLPGYNKINISHNYIQQKSHYFDNTALTLIYDDVNDFWNKS